MYKRTQATGLRKYLFIGAGSLSLGLGVLGIFLPVLPTTCFLLFSAWCYSQSSARFYGLLMGNRWFGRYLKDYHDGLGVSVKIKVLSIGSLWCSIGVTCLMWVSSLWICGLLLAIAVGVTWHICALPSRRVTHSEVAYGWRLNAD